MCPFCLHKKPVLRNLVKFYLGFMWVLRGLAQNMEVTCGSCNTILVLYRDAVRMGASDCCIRGL